MSKHSRFTMNSLKIGTPYTVTIIVMKNEIFWFYMYNPMCSKDADGMTSGVGRCQALP